MEGLSSSQILEALLDPPHDAAKDVDHMGAKSFFGFGYCNCVFPA